MWVGGWGWGGQEEEPRLPFCPPREREAVAWPGGRGLASRVEDGRRVDSSMCCCDTETGRATPRLLRIFMSCEQSMDAANRPESSTVGEGGGGAIFVARGYVHNDQRVMKDISLGMYAGVPTAPPPPPRAPSQHPPPPS